MSQFFSHVQELILIPLHPVPTLSEQVSHHMGTQQPSGGNNRKEVKILQTTGPFHQVKVIHYTDVEEVYIQTNSKLCQALLLIPFCLKNKDHTCLNTAIIYRICIIPQNSDVGLKHRHHHIIVQTYITDCFPYCVLKLVELV